MQGLLAEPDVEVPESVSSQLAEPPVEEEPEAAAQAAVPALLQDGDDQRGIAGGLVDEGDAADEVLDDDGFWLDMPIV